MQVQVLQACSYVVLEKRGRPHTSTDSSICYVFCWVTVKTLFTIMTKSAGCVMFTAKAYSTTAESRQQIQFSIEGTPSCMQITVTC